MGQPLLSLPGPLNALAEARADRIRIRFRYYATLDRLLAGQISREFTAPPALRASAQGTPSIQSVALTPDLSTSRIVVGLHYRGDTDGNGYPDDDRQGTAVLTNFSSWRPRVAERLNAALASATRLHGGYTRAPRGSFGDRDEITFDGVPMQLYEVQYRPNDFGSWRLLLRDRRSGALSAVRVATPGGSQSFGNPTVTTASWSSSSRAAAGRRRLRVALPAAMGERGVWVAPGRSRSLPLSSWGVHIHPQLATNVELTPRLRVNSTEAPARSAPAFRIVPSKRPEALRAATSATR